MTSYYERTTKWLKEQGIDTYWKVEQWNPFTKQRRDLFNIIDLLALDGKNIIGIQVCGQDFKQHERKITLEYPIYCERWLQSGGKLFLVGWRQLKVKRSYKAKKWTPRVMEFKYENKEIKLDNKKLIS